MKERRASPQEVRTILRQAIGSGALYIGHTLPSTRQLADEFGINRNTASKIYQELAADGLIDIRPNRAPTVLGSTQFGSHESPTQRLSKVLWPILHELRLSGLGEQEVVEFLEEYTRGFFSQMAPRTSRIMLVECNEQQANDYARELTGALGKVVSPILLSELEKIEVGSDVVITPLFHLRESQQILGESDATILSLVLSVDSDDVARIANLLTTGPLGIVGRNAASTERLKNLIEFQIDAPILDASLDDHRALETVLSKSEVVACTVPAAPALDKLEFDSQVIKVHYHVDDRSIIRLREQIAMLGVDEMINTGPQ